MNESLYRFLNHNIFPIQDGKYIIHSAVDNRFVWDVDPNTSNLHLWERHGGANQQFIFKANGVGVYKIMCVANGKYLDCQYSSRDNGANVWAYEFNDTSAQHWYISPEDNLNIPAHYMISVYTQIDYLKNKRCIDLTHSNASNGTNIWLWGENGTNAQKWTLEMVK